MQRRRPSFLRLFLLLLGIVLALGAWVAAAKASSAPAPQAAPNTPGVVKWRFEVDGQYILQPPAVAPDGTVAVVGSTGRLYSLTPDGALRWSVPGVGGDGGPSFGPDGTVYVGSGERITAVAPD